MAVTDTDQQQTTPGEPPRGGDRPSALDQARETVVGLWRSKVAPAGTRVGGYLGLVEPARRRGARGSARGPNVSPRGADRSDRLREDDPTDRLETATPRPAPGAKPGGRDLKGTPVAAAGATVASAAAGAAAGIAASAKAARDRAAERQRARALRESPPPPPLEYAPATAVVEDRRDLGAMVKARARTASFSTVGLLITGGIVALATVLVAQTTAPRAAAEAAEAVDAEIVLPDPEDVSLVALEARSVVYGSDGNVLDVIDREVNRSVVDFESIPQHVRQAFVAAEDRRFYEHNGYDVEGIGRAVVANFEAGGIEQGGSTITQQLAKAAVGSEESLERKIEELTYAMRLEEEYSKDELLEQYLNQVYFGERSYGIAGAAEEFFLKPHTELTVEEAALLAAMVRNPTATDPRRNPETAKARRDSVLGAMAEEGYIDPATLEQRRATPLGVAEPTSRETELPFVVDSAYREFLYSPQFAQWGDTVEERQDAFFKGGLHIHVSIDPALQQLALDVLTERFPSESEGPTGALAVVEPASGRILAAQSALAYQDEQFDIPTQGRRQPGSTYKPFVYAQAVQEGFPPSMSLDGSSPQFFPNSGGWEREDGGLENYGGASYGRMSMRDALRNSVNTAAVQLSELVGIESVIELTSRMGINNDAALADRISGERIVNPSIALGGMEEGVTPLEMASAYSTFANNGTHVRPHLIDYITDRAGNPLYTAEPAKMAAQVLDSDVNATMVEMMRGVVTGGTGTAASIPGWQVAGKTGTTQGNKDAWFVGYTPTMATAMWMGYPDTDRSTGQTGGQKPASVWRQFMSAALAGQTPVDYRVSDAAASTTVPAGQPTTVPDVRRLEETEATRTLVDANLVPDARQVASEAAPGTVIWQDPDPGSDAVSGDSIVIGVSTGPQRRDSSDDDDDDESSSSGGSSSSDGEEESSSDESSSDGEEEAVLDSEDG